MADWLANLTARLDAIDPELSPEKGAAAADAVGLGVRADAALGLIPAAAGGGVGGESGGGTQRSVITPPRARPPTVTPPTRDTVTPPTRDTVTPPTRAGAEPPLPVGENPQRAPPSRHAPCSASPITDHHLHCLFSYAAHSR